MLSTKITKKMELRKCSKGYRIEKRWQFGEVKKKESGRNWFLSLSLRGRLPTLPLSQYHRRGEA